MRRSNQAGSRIWNNFPCRVSMERQLISVSGKLTVFFEKPFWVGVFERVSDGKLSVCKVTFGAEPKDYELYEFILKKYYRLRQQKRKEKRLGR